MGMICCIYRRYGQGERKLLTRGNPDIGLRYESVGKVCRHPAWPHTKLLIMISGSFHLLLYFFRFLVLENVLGVHLT